MIYTMQKIQCCKNYKKQPLWYHQFIDESFQWSLKLIFHRKMECWFANSLLPNDLSRIQNIFVILIIVSRTIEIVHECILSYFPCTYELNEKLVFYLKILNAIQILTLNLAHSKSYLHSNFSYAIILWTLVFALALKVGKHTTTHVNDVMVLWNSIRVYIFS